MVRSVFLAVLAAFMGSAGSYERRLRREMLLLASWPRVEARGAPELVREALEHAAGVFGARRVVAAWEDAEEPWVHVASWSDGRFERWREPPGTWDPLVAPRLAGTDFLCSDVRGERPAALYTSPDGLRRDRIAPLHPGFRDRFEMRSVLSVVLRAHGLEGRLFWADKEGMTADDLLLGEVVARQVAAGLDRAELLDRLRSAAAAEERIRLARDLHDGLLQSLTAAALQIQAVRTLIAEEPEEAARRLSDVQRLIAAEQRDLRSFLCDLRPGALGPPGPLEARLEDLAQRVRRDWGIDVELKTGTIRSRIPEALGYHVCLMIHEAMVNAVRHGEARAARVEVEADDDLMRVTVADNGHGFPFRGRYDYPTLLAEKRGPVSLKERVQALGGTLAIESAASGARVEISVPLRAPEP